MSHLGAARAIAAREIGLTEAARSTMQFYDPNWRVPRSESRGKHTVTLETPWRGVGKG